MSLDTQQQMLIEQRVANDAKSPLLAYVLLIFVGWFGIHRFYLGHKGSGAAILVLTVIGFVTLPVGVGLLPLGIAGLWCVVDLFLIPGMIDTGREELRRRLALDMRPSLPPASV